VRLLESPAVIKLKLSTISSCILIILDVGGVVEVEQVCTSEVCDICTYLMGTMLMRMPQGG